jgi:hypothetical protein
MARKRGGLAGIYDRNKKLIKTIAPIAAGFIPVVGPAIGAGIGAAIGGDREGKGYFKGFNTGGALMGGVSGYGGAKLGQAAKGKLGQMFTGGGAPGGAALKLPSATNVMPNGLPGMGPNVPDVTGIGSKYVTAMPAGMPPMSTDLMGTATSRIPADPSSRFSSLGKLFGKEGMIEQNKTVLSGLGKGVMGVREGARADEQARLQMAETARMFDEQQKLRVRQQANADQTAMMDKQQFDELNANRARLRALLTGGM